MRIPLPWAPRERPHRRRGGGLLRTKFIAPLLAVAVLADVLISLGTPQHAAAAVEDYRPATYNMQGGGGKWSTDIPQLTSAGYNVISLQEAGPNPPGQLIWTSPYLSESTHWSGWRVQEYLWRPPGQSQNWHIYFVRTDFGANRVNLAILTSYDAPEVHVARPAFYGNNGLPTSRPALGITLGSTLFFSVHALASGGNDGAQLLANMSAVAGTRIWAAMGDWNRDPSNLAIRRGWHRYTAGTSTQQSGGELDYMVSNERIAGYGGVLRGMTSDHYAVGFRRLAANAGVHLLNAHDSNRDLGVDTTANGAHVNASGFRGYNTVNGSWKFVSAGNGLYSIVNRTTGKCWSDNSGRIIQWSCNGASDQLFDLNYWNDTGQLSIRPKNRTTCVGDDSQFGYGTDMLTTDSCSGGETRINFRFDYDPGPNAPLVVF
ncbi:RICIN domain-containing protein [Streptomyces acidiscabies]|uniref:RICIN domain-containing protein n=1 Tax=Streptomyces acidiscabies TaxID=42234 RepID=A0AAP6BC25_9ACTN|nr:RICIN domain-containing protein [Streptomyces acidiscabies]MBP5935767.1 hypothetical protein [Streptomyces sp. LBUM 1476]MBZ3916333.1 RICIN domain-containing protein [Streptomyces acidiscabies]MDX2961995.1 RICIN domain-containing protein [Streptomyces acidiscabies]MDX3018008.1 RICIN domain-containing protein [Streptomyces acidiscabies]MDX3791219.1 RICIN domain-containing protein [Streptomyces acidiscabies]